MSSERRYSEDEVNQILDQATEAQTSRAPSAGSSATGLTLRELQEIGREVGISEADITRAASTLDRPLPAPVAAPRFLGQQIGVGRTVELARRMTDGEWHHLVGELRETFQAKGKIQDDGAFRSWTNSNLQILLEPSGEGQRLRMRTTKGNARTFQGMGTAFMAAGGLFGVGSLLGLTRDPFDTMLITVMGAAFFFYSRITVPGWARTRAQQFEELIERVLRSMEATPLEGASDARSLEAPEGA